MLRESKGYYPWLDNHGYRFLPKAPGCRYRCPWGDECSQTPQETLRFITEKSVFDHVLIDLVYKALIRAEVRLISRYIPQRSHEERLTGSLVSELDHSMSRVREGFQEAAIRRYAEPKSLDFFYFDLSRGGKLEKETGADLAFILVLNLPDYPFVVKSILLQAKKVNGNSAQIDKRQYEVLARHAENTAYLFYDMNLETLCAPMILETQAFAFKQKQEECCKRGQASFSLGFNEILASGCPLSLFLLSKLPQKGIGFEHPSFQAAFDNVRGFSHQDDHEKRELLPLGQSARLAILSIGGRIQYSPINNESYRLSLE